MGWRTVAGAGGHWQEGGPACWSHQQARACVCHPCRYAGPGWKGSGNGCAEQKISIRPFPVVPCLASAGPKGAKQKNPSLAKRASPFLAVFPAPGGWEKATVLVTSGWSPPATRVTADIRLPQLVPGTHGSAKPLAPLLWQRLFQPCHHSASFISPRTLPSALPVTLCPAPGDEGSAATPHSMGTCHWAGLC